MEIPNNLVWGYKDDISIKNLVCQSDSGDKDKDLSNGYMLVQIFYALHDLRHPVKNLCRFTIVGLLEVSKVKVNKSNISDCKTLLDKLYELNLFKKIKFPDKTKDKTIVEYKSFSEISSTDWVEVEPNYFKLNDEGKKIEFFKLYEYELDSIINCTEKINNRELLILFCYYVSRTYHRQKYIDYEGETSYIPLGLAGAEVTFPTYEDIYIDTGISSPVVKKYNDILVDLKLIIYKNAGNRRIKFDDTTVTVNSSNTIALLRQGKQQAEAEIDASIEKFIENEKRKGTKFVGLQKTSEELTKKKISNTITALQKVKKTKGLTEEQEIKLNKFLLMKQKNEVIENSAKKIRCDNLRLLDDNIGITLSEIFENAGSYKEADKYGNLEFELELIDDAGTLLVDWDYYKKKICNYNVEQHDKILNSIRKHKNENDLGDILSRKPKGLQKKASSY